MHSWSAVPTVHKANKSEPIGFTQFISQLARHFLCTGLGVLAGTISTTMVILLAVIIQTQTVAVYSPNILLFAGAAAIAALGISWPLGRVGHRLLPTLSRYSDERGMQVILATGVLTSLLETFLFLHSL